jgi:hypothetical protein
MLAVYDRASASTREQTPENSGVVGHFYTFEDEQDRKRYDIESTLSTIESAAAPVLEKLSKGLSISIAEREVFAMFVATASVRTPAFIESVSGSISSLMKFVTQTAFGNVEIATAQLKDAGLLRVDTDVEGLVQFAQSGDFNIEVNRQFATGMAMQQFGDLARIFMRRHWRVVSVRNKSKSFITSDSPVVLSSIEPPSKRWSGIGYGLTNAIVQFPLNQESVLLLLGDGGTHDLALADADEVRRINEITASRCQRFLFGRSKEQITSIAKAKGLAASKWQPFFRSSRS